MLSLYIMKLVLNVDHSAFARLAQAIAYHIIIFTGFSYVDAETARDAVGFKYFE